MLCTGLQYATLPVTLYLFPIAVNDKLTARFAIYFSPSEDSELGIFGATVLRRKSICSSEWLHPKLPVQFPADSCWHTQIQVPAHYGFHATIKAPFELANGQTIGQLQIDLEQFCASQQPIALTGVKPTRTPRYHALAYDPQSQQPSELRQMAADCVQHFEPFRAALTDADIKRRNPSLLTPEQRDNLSQYGYPYVLDDFNFHMTLSGAKNQNDENYLRWLTQLYQTMVTETPVLDRLSIFYQPDRDTAFVQHSEFLFAQTRTNPAVSAGH